MPGEKDLLIQSFQYGLDTRRSELTSKPGSLVQCENGHINQGAQIEKRKLFLPLRLPAVVLGCDGALNGIILYSSAATPSGFAAWPAFNTSWAANNTVPASYLRLQSPLFDGSIMVSVIWSTLFGGLPFVIAKFASGNVFVFQATTTGYTVVTDFYAGLVLSGYTMTADQATNLAALVINTTNYHAVAVGNTVTITGENGANFTATSTDSSAGGSISSAISNVGVPATPAQAAIGSFAIVAGALGTGATNAGVGFVYVNDVASNIMAGTILWTGDPLSMAVAVAASINSVVGTNGGYSALANGGTVSVYAPPGATPNSYTIHVGTQTSSNYDGAICTQNCNFVFTAPAGSTLSISSVTTTLGPTTISPSGWSGSPIALSSYASLNAFLQAVATGITQASSSNVNYVAVAVGNILYISANGDENNTAAATVTITYSASGATVSGTPSLRASVNPTIVYGAGQIVQVTVIGGVGPYKYSWTMSNPAIFMSSQSSASNSFVTSLPAPYNLNGVAVCTITDSSGASAVVIVNVNLINTFTK